MLINYKIGDATDPKALGLKVIVHCCNDIGVWGAGFVLALSKKWKQPENAYREWHAQGVYDGETFDLGGVIFIRVEPDIIVANLIGQRGVGRTMGGPPVRYKAIKMGLDKVAYFCLDNNASIHMPRIGCGLAGGLWPRVEELIQNTLLSKGLEVNVYDLK